MPFIHSSTAVAGTENHDDNNTDHQGAMNQTIDTATGDVGAGVAKNLEDMERYIGDVSEGDPGQQWTHVDRHSNSRHSQKRRMLKTMGNSVGAVDNINSFRPRAYRTNSNRENPPYSASVGSHTLPRARTANNFHGPQQPSNGVPDDVVSSTSQLSLQSGPIQTVESRLIQSDHVSPTSPTATSVSSSELHNGFDNGSGGGCEDGGGRDNHVVVDCHPHGRPMRTRGGFRSYCDSDDFSPRGYYSYRPQHPLNHPCNNHTPGPTATNRPPGRFARSPTSVANLPTEEQWRRPANGPGWRRPHHTMSFPSRGHGSYYSHRFNPPNTFNHYQQRPRFRMARPQSPPRCAPSDSFKSYIRPALESPTITTVCDTVSASAETILERPELDRQTTSWAAAVAATPPQNEQKAVAVREDRLADSSLIAFMQSQWKLFSRQSESSASPPAYLST